VLPLTPQLEIPGSCGGLVVVCPWGSENQAVHGDWGIRIVFIIIYPNILIVLTHILEVLSLF